MLASKAETRYLPSKTEGHHHELTVAMGDRPPSGVFKRQPARPCDYGESGRCACGQHRPPERLGWPR